MAVVFEELGNSPRFTGSATELTGVREGIIPWTDLDAFFLELFPPAILGTAQYTSLMPGSSVLRAERVTYEPWPPEAAVTNTGFSPNEYASAKATVEYKTNQQQSNGTQLYTRRIAISGEFMTLPALSLQWAGTPATPVKSPDISAGKIICMTEVSITLHRVENPPEALIQSLLGKVNNASFDGCAAETLLFLGADMRQTTTSDGSQPWEVELRFQQRVIDGDTSLGWNHFYKTEGVGIGTFQRLQTKSGDPIYKLGDFSQFYA